MTVWRGAVAGLVGGLVAAGAMSLVHSILGDISKPEKTAPEEPPASAPGDSSRKEEDATVKVALVVARRLGVPLADADKEKAGTLVHYAFGAGVGAFYGGLAEAIPFVTLGQGLPFGAGVWLGAHVLVVPALGLAKSPTRQPLGGEAQELGLHLLYGLITEATRRALRRVLAGPRPRCKQTPGAAAHRDR